MYRAILLASATLCVLLLGAGCNGDSKGDKPSSPTVNGTPVTDEEYLKAICTGTTNFSNALISKTKPEEIAAVIKDFSASMKRITPPEDLETFHKEFTKYLDDSLSDPTSLITRRPPEPAEKSRQRLVSKETSVSECRDGTFFDAQGAGTSTPAK